MMNVDVPPVEPLLLKHKQKLDYDVSAWSSHSASYHPKNILSNKPSDQSSRWSSGTNDQMQFITLKLDRMSVVSSITFGKYHKVHVCNLKEFKVYGGLSPNNMTELLHSGLKNDSDKETFSLKHKANGVVFPCLYIKITPLLAWGANFNFSIWYLELHGTSDKDLVQRVYQDYVKFRETEVIRLCLKHFRQRNYQDTFESLQKRTDLKLEDDLLTEIHQKLVIEGDFNTSEHLINEAARRGLFNEYISGCKYKPQWNRILSEPEATPSMRGGHQMCIDVPSGLIYLFGGWDGAKEMSDFWTFDIALGIWKCISPDTRRQGGPSPRSCHKICFDEKTKTMYVLGRYVDPDARPNIPLENDFWKYEAVHDKWTCISGSTSEDGGPELIYDHQMVMDTTKENLLVFGGRVVGADSTQVVYSGLYIYSVQTQVWKLLRTETETPIELKSRIGHSMLLNETTRELFIFAGQRNKDYLADFYVYHLDSDDLRQISRDYSKQGGPDAGFTQRATIDPQLGEFYVFSGLIKEKNNTQESVKNSLWVYNIRKESWSKIYQNENTGADYWSKMSGKEPCPRFAHQLVYDYKSKTQYLFGGNPGDNSQPNMRLDDFWQLELQRPKIQDILRLAVFKIRRQVFREMCRNGDSLTALKYLQTQVSASVNHDDETESKTFRHLTSMLFSWGDAVAMGDAPSPVSLSQASVVGGDESGKNHQPDFYPSRTELYEALLEFFPDTMREPKGNIVDLVPMM